MFNTGILFYHEGAGQGDVHIDLGDVTVHLSKMCKQLTLYKSTKQGEIYEACKLLTESETEVIFVLGGDGTVHELVNGVMDAELNLPIGILPGGTFNDFTKTLNLPAQPLEASIVISQSHIKHIDVIKVNERYALNFIGMGLIVDNSEGVNKEMKNRIGKFSYFLTTLKTMSNPEYFDYEINVDDVKYSGQSPMILIANGEFVGGNRIPLKELSADDGLLDVFIFKDAGLKLIGELLTEKSIDDWNEISPSIEHHRGKKISINTSQEMPVDVDGEIDLKTPVHAEVLTKRLRMFAVPL